MASIRSPVGSVIFQWMICSAENKLREHGREREGECERERVRSIRNLTILATTLDKTRAPALTVRKLVSGPKFTR